MPVKRMQGCQKEAAVVLQRLLVGNDRGLLVEPHMPYSEISGNMDRMK